MFQFEWTLSLGNIISTLVLLATFVVGILRLVTNHLAHLEARINARFDGLDKDIRELRDWTIVMRGERTSR